jgi:hypothetical protein
MVVIVVGDAAGGVGEVGGAQAAGLVPADPAYAVAPVPPAVPATRVSARSADTAGIRRRALVAGCHIRPGLIVPFLMMRPFRCRW